MNELSIKRAEKLLEFIKGNPAGMFDEQIARDLKWNISAVRSVCSVLRKSGKIIVKNNQDKWFIIADDENNQQYEYGQDDDSKLKKAASKFGNSLSELIYVIFSNRK